MCVDNLKELIIYHHRRPFFLFCRVVVFKYECQCLPHQKIELRLTVTFLVRITLSLNKRF